MKSKILLYFGLLLLFLSPMGCKEKEAIKNKEASVKRGIITHAKGLSIKKSAGFTVITVHDPWPNAKRPFKYVLVPREKLASTTFAKNTYDAIVPVPVASLVATSTTHIPALESLEGLATLKGFPNTKYISSMPARKLISNGKIMDVGANENLNTEITLELEPDAVIGFAINNENSTYDLLQQAGIPVLFNGDWTERTPLGKAEWIKFFGALLDKEQQADSIFKSIERSYTQVAALAKQAQDKPSVMSGALYKDVWYFPAGESWAAQFMTDANAAYLWSASKGTGSLSLSLESVLEKGQQAEYWIAPGQFTHYSQLEVSNSHYIQFEAFKNKKVHTFSATKGPTGGLLYYELAPQRPDLVLKDLVHIFHKELMPDHVPFFFKALEP